MHNGVTSLANKRACGDSAALFVRKMWRGRLPRDDERTALRDLKRFTSSERNRERSLRRLPDGAI
jgi:hypothetical protein